MNATATPNAHAIFYQQYSAVRRDEIVGLLLALFLGSFGAHHFYLRRTALGVVYCCFFWSGIPTILGIIECFFMPRRVREFNTLQAAVIAANLGINVPAWDQAPPVSIPINAAGASNYQQANPIVCSQCAAMNPAGSRFCSSCGNSL